jgi:hypothetical protein
VGRAEVPEYQEGTRSLQIRANPPKIETMNVSSATSVQASLRAAQSSESGTGAAVQLAMLKKALESQQSEASALLKAFEGKGQNLDIRV